MKPDIVKIFAQELAQEARNSINEGKLDEAQEILHMANHQLIRTFGELSVESAWFYYKLADIDVIRLEDNLDILGATDGNGEAHGETQ